MSWLAADPDSSSRISTCRTLYVLLTKHSFPSRLHQEPTVHKSVPNPISPASFKTTRGLPSRSQASHAPCVILVAQAFHAPPLILVAQAFHAPPLILVAQAFQPVADAGRDAPPTRDGDAGDVGPAHRIADRGMERRVIGRASRPAKTTQSERPGAQWARQCRAPTSAVLSGR